MSDLIRSFLAVELSAEAKQFLKGIQQEFKKVNGDVRWVKPENIHLTLKFLKEVEREKIDEVITAVAEKLKNVKAFEMEFTGSGAFPDLRQPRIIWVGLKDTAGEIDPSASLRVDTEPSRSIKDLAGQVETALRPLSFPKDDRDFQAHITIGRVRSLKNIGALTDTIKGSAPTAGPTQRIGAVTLFQSTLTPDGPIYEVLKKFPLL